MKTLDPATWSISKSKEGGTWDGHHRPPTSVTTRGRPGAWDPSFGGGEVLLNGARNG